MGSERRQHTRVPVGFDISIRIGDEAVPVKTWNLSLRGVCCSADPRFARGQECVVHFALDPNNQFKIEATILRTSEEETGIYFKSMDEDSFFHLKRCVQYNAEDPDRIDFELSNPVEKE